LRREGEGGGGGEGGVEDAAERGHEVGRDGLAGREALVDERLVLQLLPLRRRERVPSGGGAAAAAGATAHHHHLGSIRRRWASLSLSPGGADNLSSYL
jgi:hypothetical protein